MYFLNISLLLSPLDGVCQLDVLDRPKRLLKIVDFRLSQIKKKNMNKATMYRVLIVENISNPLENINIKFIHDITV